MSTISERILSAISKAKLSYSELSELTKIPKAALQRYATGATPKVPLDRLEAIAKATNVSPEYIIGWDIRGKQGERIKSLRTFHKLSREKFAKMFDVDSIVVSDWEEGRSDISSKTIEDIADHFEVPIDYVLGKSFELKYPMSQWEDDCREDYDNAPAESREFLKFKIGHGIFRSDDQHLTPTEGINIPVLGDVAAGVPIEAITDIIDYEEISPDMVKDGSEYFALRIKGDSMEPKISDGDVVIVRKQPDVDSGQIAIVCVNGDNATCKKVMKQENGILLVSNNPTYAPVFYSNDDIINIPITILGRVVELRAKF